MENCSEMLTQSLPSLSSADSSDHGAHRTGREGLCDPFVNLLGSSFEHSNHKEIFEPMGKVLYGLGVSP